MYFGGLFRGQDIRRCLQNGTPDRISAPNPRADVDGVARRKLHQELEADTQFKLFCRRRIGEDSEVAARRFDPGFGYLRTKTDIRAEE